LDRPLNATLADRLVRRDRPGRTGRVLRCAVAAATLLSAAGAHAQTAGRRPGAPPAVIFITVHKQELNQSSSFIGHVQAIQTVNVHAQVAGYLRQVAFKGGQDVKKGQLLYVIEPAQYRAAVAAAEAKLQSARALLKQAHQNLTRQQRLYAKGNTPQSTLQQAEATYDVDDANVAAAKAQLQTANINFGYTRITSPIDGRAGATAVTAGNLVGPTTGTLTTIVQLNPIRVVFSINERSLVAFREKHPKATQQQINARFIPNLRLPGGSMYGQAGRVAFVNNQVDSATGTLAVYADFPNPRDLLLPGMLVTAVVSPEHPAHGFLVPAGAVLQDRRGKYVLVVGPGNKLERRDIITGAQIDQSLAVTGLKNGDRVVVAGLQKVHLGQVVNPIAEGVSHANAAAATAPLSTAQPGATPGFTTSSAQ